jgi:hypothetical protein
LSINCFLLSQNSSDPYTLYAGTIDRGIWYSPDSGDHWAQFGDENMPAVWSMVEVIDKEQPILLAGTQEQGVIRLADQQQAVRR